MLASLWMTLMGILLLVQPATAQELGVLRVGSNVDGAVVHVDSELLGPTPMTREMPPGSYMVRVTADGFDPYVRKVQVSSGKTKSLDARLSIGGGTADFMVEPSGARVEINGQDSGLVTPTRLTGLADGRYRYRVLKEGYEPLEGSFEIKASSNPMVSVKMESSMGRFEVVSEPAGATVYIDGEQMGQTPLNLEGVHPGVHQVGLTLDGHALLVREVDTSDGSKGSINAHLKKEGGKITVKTGSADAQVSLDGVPVGTGKSVKVQATRGSYALQVSAPGMAPASGTAKIPVSGSVLYQAELDSSSSSVAQGTPLARRWTFWTGVGVGVAAIGTGSAIAVAATRPGPPPTGDVALTLP